MSNEKPVEKKTEPVLIDDKELIAADGIIKALNNINSHESRTEVLQYICRRFKYKV